jgi:hypothetical protein
MAVLRCFVNVNFMAIDGSLLGFSSRELEIGRLPVIGEFLHLSGGVRFGDRDQSKMSFIVTDVFEPFGERNGINWLIQCDSDPIGNLEDVSQEVAAFARIWVG